MTIVKTFTNGQDILDAKNITCITYDEIVKIMRNIRVVSDGGKFRQNIVTCKYKDLDVTVTYTNSHYPNIVTVEDEATVIYKWASDWDGHDKDYGIVWQSDLAYFLKGVK